MTRTFFHSSLQRLADDDFLLQGRASKYRDTHWTSARVEEKKTPPCLGQGSLISTTGRSHEKNFEFCNSGSKRGNVTMAYISLNLGAFKSCFRNETCLVNVSSNCLHRKLIHEGGIYLQTVVKLS